MNRNIVKTLLMWAIINCGMLPACWAGIDHRPLWTGSTGISYNLDDLDNFPSAGYLYCKWGNLMDQNTLGQVNLNFTRLTRGSFNNITQNQDGPAADLFLSYSGYSDPRRTMFPSYTTWDPAGGSLQAGSATYTVGSIFDSNNIDLYRYLHFSGSLTNTLSGLPIDSWATKIIVLIHGWNPYSNTDAFADNDSDPNAGDEFQALVDSIESQIQGTGWKLVLYHWEADSDTGPKIISEAAINGTEAAEIGNQHGWHLGELLTTKCPYLEKVHFVAHSAGSWTARAASRHLLTKNDSIRVQVTLLDPFMPSSVPYIDSVLGNSIMSSLDGVSGSSRIHLLENYWATDLDGALGTSDIFNWRSGDVNLRVDWSVPNSIPIFWYYENHAGPIRWYADTVASASGSSNPGLAPFDLWETGWRRSLFCNEPVISSQPQAATKNIGDSAAFTVTANTRIGHYSHYHCGELSYQWRKDYVPLSGKTGATLTIPSVSASDAGAYSVVVSNSTGPVFSQDARLTVTGGALSQPDLSPASGSYQAPLDVALIGYPSDVTIRYTLNGTTPNGSSPIYSGSPIRLTTTTTIKAISQKSGFTDSLVKSATYTLSGYGTLPTITSVNGGNAVVGSASRQWITINGTGFESGFSAKFRDETYETDWPVITDTTRLTFDSANQVRVYAGVGTGPAEWSVWITNPNGASSEKKRFDVSAAGSVAQVATPAFSDVSGTFPGPIQLSMATITPDAQIRFTTDNSDPTSSSQLYTGPITIGVTTTVKAKAFKFGYTTSGTQTATFIISTPATGSLRVDLGPTAAVQAGARWQVNGGAWRSSGETANGISVGNPVVAFNTVSGWLSPLARSVTINAGLTTYDNATYILENVAPTVPANPSPANGAGNMGRINTVLSWTGGDQGGTVEYALKFGTDPNPGFYAGYGSIAGTAYTVPLTLEGGTVYYWGVRAKDSKGATTDSPIWSFTTAYSYSDLVPANLNVAGIVAPGSNVTLSVTVRNTGTFVAQFAYIRFYLSRSLGAKEVQLTSAVPSSRVYNVEPGQEQTVTFDACLTGLQAGRSYIDAWIDSGQPGPFNENNFENNLLSAEINYTDASAPEVTVVQLGQGGFIRTAYTNRIIYAVRDDTGVKTIDFLYSTNGGTNWTALQTNYVPKGNCTYGDGYDWLIPTNIPVTSNFCIKVVAKDAAGNAGEKVAGPYLLRSGVSPLVQVLTPNGGEILDMGSKYNISWSLSAPNGVSRVHLSFTHGDSADGITYIYTNSPITSYSWQLPLTLTTASGKICVEIMDANGNKSEDWSDGFFTIRDTSATPPAPWTNATVLTASPTNSPRSERGNSQPVLAVDAWGNVHMAYAYSETSGDRPYVTKQQVLYSKRVGNVWSVPSVVYSVTQENGTVGGTYNQYVSGIDIVADTNGLPHIVWLSKPDAPNFLEMNKTDIWYSRWTGAAWITPTNMSDTIHGDFFINLMAWTRKADMPAAVSGPVVASAGGKVYLFGAPTVSDTWEYYPQNNTWTKKAQISSGYLPSGQGVESGGMIYVLSGGDGRMRKYNPAANSWTDGAVIPVWQSDPCMISAGGKIYVVGNNSTATYVYDTSADSWTTKADRSKIRIGQLGASVGGKVYLFGGQDSSDRTSVDIFDPAANVWNNKPAPDAANWPDITASATAVISNRVYFMGHMYSDYIQNRADRYVREYDADTHTWTLMQPLGQARYLAGACAVGGRLYTLGGTDGFNDVASVEEAVLSNALVGAISMAPAICLGASNTVHIVWGDGRFYRPDGSRLPFGAINSGTNTLYHRYRSALGQWTAPIQIATNSISSFAPALSADLSGKIHAFGVGYANGTNSVYHLTYTNGAWIGPTIAGTIANSWVRGCVDSQNRLHVLWQYYEPSNATLGVAYRVFENGVWSNTEYLAWGQYDSGSICCDSWSRPHLVLTAASSKHYVMYSTRNGASWTAPVQIHTTSQLPEGDIGDATMYSVSNEIHAVWSSYQNNHPEILYNHASVGSLNDVYPPTVSMTAPFSGQSIPSGAGFSIQWTANDNFGVSNIDLHYSTNDGSSWQVIRTNQANTGSYLWMVPLIGTNIGLVRVTARDSSGNAGMGYSGQFTTADLTPPTIAILFPSAGATLTGNSIINIQWNAFDNVAVTELAIECSIDNGKAWSEISRGLSNTNTLAWQLPNISTTGLLLRVTACDAAGFTTSCTASQSMTIVRANNPPTQPNSPFPMAACGDVLFTSPYLHWSSADLDGDLIAYQVRFGTAPSPGLVYSGVANSFIPKFLHPQTTYYWQVVASDGKTNVASPVWSFTTASGITPPSRFTASRMTDGEFQLELEGILGENYRVEYSTNLTSQSWFPVTNTTIGLEYSKISISISTNQKARFFRAVTP